LVTTVFFADDPDAARDPVLNCVKDAAARKRLFARREKPDEYRFDIVLRGEGETPFFLD
jgi:protocatechuate 3,4-dioxygenase beta subunit